LELIGLNSGDLFHDFIENMMSARKPNKMRARRTKPRKSGGRAASGSKTVHDGDLGAVVHDSIEQRLFFAAFSSSDPVVFGRVCVNEIALAMGARDVVLILDAGSKQKRFLASTSEAARKLALGRGASGPLAMSHKFGRQVARVLVASAGPRKGHDALAVRAGYKGYLCQTSSCDDAAMAGVPRMSIAVYFDCKVSLKKKAEMCRLRLLPLVTAAMAAIGRVEKSLTPNSFSSLAAAIPGVVYQRIVRPDGDIRYTYLSEGARELFGVDPEAVLRDPEVLFRTYSDEYRKNFRERLVSASATLTKWDVEASVVLPDGGTRTTHAIARPERLPDGSVLWTGVILDASRAKEAEDGLKEANRLVGLANQAKSAFLAKMSHEMRTPLNGVLGMGDILLKTDLSPRQTRLATTLCESARSLLGIINDVLDLSRIEAGHFKLDLQDFNLRHCVEDAVELCATSGYRKGLEVNLIVHNETPIGVKSDPVRLRQVLINLIGNSIKFTETGEVVVRMKPVQTSSGDVAVAFEVVDTGIGIDAPAISRLFEPFAQADSSISRRFGGTGLGLSITRHLVELMGGTIELASERGRGTTVRFVLPLEVTAAAHTSSILSQISLTGTRVLVMDDRATNREAMMANASGCGARVDGAGSESELLELLERGDVSKDPYSVIVVDRVRPRLNGLHLCRTVRNCARFNQTAIVALMSANWNINPIDQAGLINTQFLSKPARRTDLLAAIARSQNLDVDASGMQSELAKHSRSHAAVAPALRLRVLLVEDNPTNIEVAREYLNELDCRVTVAMNGIEAITAYDQANFDVILMDTQMPELDGLSATRRIRESERLKGRVAVPIVTVTANAYESDRVQALEAGANDFLSKPFTDQQLRAVLEKYGRRSEVVDVHRTQPILDAVTPKAVAVGDASGEPQLDEALHKVLAQSRPAFLGRLLRAFLSSMPETLAALRAAVSQSDPQLLRSVVHSLKSSSANVGAKRLYEHCRVIDMKLRLGADPADCEILAAGVTEELGQVAQAFERLLARLTEAGPVAVARA
jgi:signal transduction histidine kinase/CheY-like chemotaxis protein